MKIGKIQVLPPSAKILGPLFAKVPFRNSLPWIHHCSSQKFFFGTVYPGSATAIDKRFSFFGTVYPFAGFSEDPIALFRCELTIERCDHPVSDVIMFHLPSLRLHDVPGHAHPRQVLAVETLESPEDQEASTRRGCSSVINAN